MPWLRPPPGLVLEPGERLTLFELCVEWIAYLHETKSDMLLAAAIAITLYDLVWTPCLWLLPIEVGVSSLVVGFVIDLLVFVAIAISATVWGLYGHLARFLMDTITCVPWELIGLTSADRLPLMWVRALVKVRRPKQKSARASRRAGTSAMPRLTRLCCCCRRRCARRCFGSCACATWRCGGTART